MDLPHKIIRYRKNIDQCIASFLSNEKKHTFSHHIFALPAIDAIEKRIYKGKHIRGCLVPFMTDALGGIKEDKKFAVNIGAMLELIHLGILIHDDIIDNDNTRRGLPTIHVYFQKKFSVHESCSLALCIGDYLIYLAYKLFMQSHLSLSKKEKIYACIARYISCTILAQVDDIYMATLPFSQIKSRDILRLYKNKSAQYTFTLPFEIGAYIAENTKVVPSLLRLGTFLGTLFQIRDDMIDIYLGKNKTGKPRGSDIKEGKRTYLMHLFYKKASLSDQKKMNNFFKKKHLTEKDMQDIISLLDTYKIEYILRKKIKTLADSAKDIIASLPMKSTDKDVLNTLVSFMKIYR